VIYKMVSEKVKYTDGEEVEVNIIKLSARQVLVFLDQYVPLEGIKQNKDGSVEMAGSIKLFKLKEKCLETIKDLDIDKLDGEEVTRIYDKYFAEAINLAMGQGGSPN